jgi:hypothetical protein
MAVASAKGIKSYSEAAASAKKKSTSSEMFMMPASVARDRGLLADGSPRPRSARPKSGSRPSSPVRLVSKSLHTLPAVRDRRGRPLMHTSSKPNFSRAKRVTTEIPMLTRGVDFVDSYTPNNVKRTSESYV